MCYSTALRKQKEQIEQILLRQIPAKFPKSTEYNPYYHLNGFTYGNLQIITMEDQKTIRSAKWGLIPNWASHNPEEFRKKSNTLNARSESIFEKASFKESAENKRCLILADGFFEPHHENGQAIPYFCYQPSTEYPEGDLFLFAGLYNALDDSTLNTTILTTEANSFFMEVHNKGKRMPLILDPLYFGDWLDNGISDQAINEMMAIGLTRKEFKAHPISRDLYKKGIDTNKPYIIEPVQKNTLF
jgi:putative SOS response-associated peptidase YedK